MKVLLTGSQGYVGSAFVEHSKVSLKSHQVDGIDLGLFQNLNHYTVGNNDIYLNSIIFKDLRNIQVSELIGYDAIVHLAAISNDPIGEKYSKITNEINFVTTIDLAKKSKSAGIKKFIFASSASVYGFSEKICFENSETNPITAYAKSKLYSEIELSNLSDLDFQVTILRFATAAGWSSRIRSDIALNNFVIQATTSKEILLNSAGDAFRPFVDVKDMAKAIEFALSDGNNSRKSCEIYNIGSNEWNFKIVDLAKIVAQTVKDTKIVINTKSNSDARSYVLNFDKYNSIAGKFKITREIEQSILELKNNILRILEFENSQYFHRVIRLDSIERLILEKIIDENLNLK